MKLTDARGKDLMTVSALARDGDALVIKGKIFGTMPMSARLPLERPAPRCAC